MLRFGILRYFPQNWQIVHKQALVFSSELLDNLQLVSGIELCIKS